MAAEQDPPGAVALPNNVEAEAALLGALMLTNKAIDQIADRLAPEHFYEPLYGRVYSAIVKEHSLGRNANPVTLRPYFTDDGAMQELGGAAHLAELTGSGAAIVGFRDFADQIIELSRRRVLLERLADISMDASNWEKSYAELVAEAETAIADAGRASDDGTVELALADAMSLALDTDHSEGGITCGIEAIDNSLGPIQPKEMVVIAGRPGMGKTVVAMSYALGVVRAHSPDLRARRRAARRRPVHQPRDECQAARSARRRGPVLRRHDGHLLRQHRRPEAEHGPGRAVARAIDRIRTGEIPLQIVDAPRMTVGRLGTTVRRWKRRFAARGVKLRLVVVDYLQLVQPDQREKDLYTRITEVSKGLKAVAKANDVGLIALAQLSRDVEKRGGDHRPNLGDLRDSGQIEQDADGVMFLYRREYYLKKEEPAARPQARLVGRADEQGPGPDRIYHRQAPRASRERGPRQLPRRVPGGPVIGDTHHLTLEEHGAYWKLLLIAWRSPDCALPDDDKRLAMMLGVTLKKWSKLKPVVMAFWTLIDGRWKQKKQTNVRQFVEQKREQSREASAARWNGQADENKGNGSSGRTTGRKSERMSGGDASQTQTHKKSSVGKPTGAESADFDPVKAFIDDGVRLLTAAGSSEKAARSIIGRWRKEHGDDGVALAIAAADSRHLSQPIEWISRRLTTRSESGSAPGRPRSFLEVVTEELKHEEPALEKSVTHP
jgi:replicative DNA helicase